MGPFEMKHGWENTAFCVLSVAARRLDRFLVSLLLKMVCSFFSLLWDF